MAIRRKQESNNIGSPGKEIILTERVPEWRKDYLKFKACKPGTGDACL